MSSSKRPRKHAMSEAAAALAFASLTVACAPAASEGSSETTPSSKSRPPDVTEVTMEVTPIDAGAPHDPGAPSATASTSKPAPAAADPSEDPMIGGAQEGAVEKAVAPIRPRIRACYKKALAVAPHTGGTATFDATMSRDGRVASARFVKRDGLTDDMVGCLLTAVKSMVFEIDPSKKSQIVTFSFGAPGAAESEAAGATPPKK